MTMTRYTNWREQGKIVLEVAAVLEKYEAARWEHDEHADHKHTQECVQADAALTIASTGDLWRMICGAKTVEDLLEAAEYASARGDAEQNDGCGWDATVWYEVEKTIRHLTE